MWRKVVAVIMGILRVMNEALTSRSACQRWEWSTISQTAVISQTLLGVQNFWTKRNYRNSEAKPLSSSAVHRLTIKKQCGEFPTDQLVWAPQMNQWPLIPDSRLIRSSIFGKLLGLCVIWTPYYGGQQSKVHTNLRGYSYTSQHWSL